MEQERSEIVRGMNSKANDGNSIHHYPTITEIAKRCGISVSTVSRALNNVAGEQSEETRQRIVAAASEMGYDPMRFHSARQLVSIRDGKHAMNYLIGFFFHHFHSSGFVESNYFAKIQRGVLSAAANTEFEIVTSDIMRSNGAVTELPSIYRRGEIDGIIAMEDFAGSLNMLRADPGFGSRPIVWLAGSGESGSCVRPDDYRAGYLVMSHLLDIGHRGVMTLYSMENEDESILGGRMRGFIDACRDRGLDARECLIQGHWNSNNLPLTEELLVHSYNENPHMTGLIAPNDYWAQKFYWMFARHGISIPEHLSMVSFDDTDAITDSEGSNILTTVRLPLDDIGRQGVELLVRRILGEEKEDRETVLPVELVVRGSTAAPARRCPDSKPAQ
jgi:DNA-binding LacI/PurR family transcriptional regulator